MSAAQEIVIRPLTPERWEDFVELFGPNGASQGCWCMFWRIRSKDYHSQSGETNRSQMKNLVDSGFEPGLLAYIDGNPAGWAAVALRSDYARLVNSRVLKAVDDEPVWSLPCFFIHRKYRRKGLMGKLIQAACDYARRHGADLIEAYPKETKNKRIPSGDAYTGVVSAFEDAGFEEVARNTPTRPIMRLELNDDG